MGNEPSTSGGVDSGEGLGGRVRLDRATLAEFYDRYYPSVVKYCVRRMFDRATAEDVASEVFLKVAASARTFSGTTESDFRGWLFRIAANAVNAHLRSASRRRTLLEQAARSGRLDRVGPQPSVAVDAATLDWPLVYQALMELEEREQTIVSLRFFADLSHAEISDVMQSTPAAVRTALSRALSRLRARFGSRDRSTGVPGDASQG